MTYSHSNIYAYLHVENICESPPKCEQDFFTAEYR